MAAPASGITTCDLATNGAALPFDAVTASVAGAAFTGEVANAAATATADLASTFAGVNGVAGDTRTVVGFESKLCCPAMPPGPSFSSDGARVTHGVGGNVASENAVADVFMLSCCDPTLGWCDLALASCVLSTQHGT